MRSRRLLSAVVGLIVCGLWTRLPEAADGPNLIVGLSQTKGRFTLVDLLDNTRMPVSNPKAFTLELEPYKARVLQVVPDSR